MSWKRDKNSVHMSYREWKTTDKYKEQKSRYDIERMKDPALRDEKRRRGKEEYWRRKILFFDMYGDRCACCGEATKEFLTMEHINGLQGQQRHRGMNQYKDAIKEYRPDLYEVLCMNCNHAIGRVGYCPHNPNRRIKE